MRSNGEWHSITTAPRHVPVALLIHDSGKLKAAVGQWRDGGWEIAIPLSSQRLSVAPAFWYPLPPIPASAG
jgi:hypothetical protein